MENWNRRKPQRICEVFERRARPDVDGRDKSCHDGEGAARPP